MNMRRFRWSALSTLAIAAGVGMQSSTAAASRPDQGAAQPSPQEQTVTIVGCLMQGDPTAPPDSVRAHDYFVRTPAIEVPVGTTVAVGRPTTPSSSGSGTGATTSAGMPDKTTLYRIAGLDPEQLRPLLHHRIELQGRLSSDETGSNTTAKTSVDAKGQATVRVETRMLVAGVLRATTLKMLSASCQ